jgi:hypothetical protein
LRGEVRPAGADDLAAEMMRHLLETVADEPVGSERPGFGSWWSRRFGRPNRPRGAVGTLSNAEG